MDAALSLRQASNNGVTPGANISDTAGSFGEMPDSRSTFAIESFPFSTAACKLSTTDIRESVISNLHNSSWPFLIVCWRGVNPRGSAKSRTSDLSSNIPDTVTKSPFWHASRNFCWISLLSFFPGLSNWSPSAFSGVDLMLMVSIDTLGTWNPVSRCRRSHASSSSAKDSKSGGSL